MAAPATSPDSRVRVIRPRRYPSSILPATSLELDTLTDKVLPLVSTAYSFDPELARGFAFDLNLVISGQASATFSQIIDESTFILRKDIIRLFKNTSGEDFEDGMDNDFSSKVISLVEEYGNQAISIIGEMIDLDDVSPSVVAESLKALTNIENSALYNSQLTLFEQGLLNRQSDIRDAALGGISWLASSTSIQPLRQAIQYEPLPLLRDCMKQVLALLEQLNME